MKKFIVLFLVIHFSFAIDIGSDTLITNFAIQQTAQNGDRFALGAVLNGGFSLANTNATILFDALFPVSGVVGLGGGQLILNQDLVFRNVLTLPSFGSIIGNNHSLSLSGFAQLPQAEAECDLFSFDSISGLSGDVDALDFSSDSQFIAASVDSTTAPGRLRVYKIVDKQLIFIAGINPTGGTNTMIPDVRWNPINNIIAVARSASATEVLTFIFDPQASTIVQADAVAQPGRGRAVAWHPSGGFLAAGGTGNAAELRIYSVDGLGNLTQVINVNIAPNRDVQFKSLGWDSSGTFLAVGLNSSGSNPTVLVYEFDPGVPSLILNASIDVGFVRSIDWNKQFSNLLAVGLDNVELPNNLVQVLQHNNVAGTLSVLLSQPGFTSDVGGISWSPDGICLATGSDITGGIGLLEVFRFNSIVPSLTSVFQRSFGANVRAVRWASNGKLVGSGDDTNQLSVFGTSLLEDFFVLSDLSIILNNDLEFRAKANFSGKSSISGYGLSLTVTQTGVIQVDSDSELLFKDITLKGISNNNLYNSSSSSKMKFDNVHIFLDGTLTFTHGSFEVINNLVISTTHGNDAFSFYADKTSNVINKTFVVNK